MPLYYLTPEQFAELPPEAKAILVRDGDDTDLPLRWETLHMIDDSRIPRMVNAKIAAVVADIEQCPVPGKRSVTLKVELDPHAEKTATGERLTGRVTVRAYVDDTIPKRGGFATDARLSRDGTARFRPDSDDDAQQISVLDLPGVRASMSD